MKKSHYKNWRKRETNAIEKEISSVFPVYVYKGNTKGMFIEFENDDAKRITFYLDENDTELFKMNFDKNILGKDVKRSDYNFKP